MESHSLKISPSILSADFAQLKNELIAIEQAGADYVHIDVMDGHFVPNLTFGPPVIKAIRPHSKLIFDVHLMIEQPERFIKDYAAAGADIITIHVESTKDIQSAISLIKECNVKVGIALKPKTSADLIEKYIDQLDLVLIMTVEPGFGGQKFMQDQVGKISAIKNMSINSNLNIDIAVDGGIDDQTAHIAIQHGANTLVAGSYIFSGGHPGDYQGQILKLRKSFT